MRPDDHTPRDAGWPDALDQQYGGDGRSEPADRYLREHPGASTFFDALRAELDPPRAASFDAAAGLAKILAHDESVAGPGVTRTASPRTAATQFLRAIAPHWRPLVGCVAGILAIVLMRGQWPRLSGDTPARAYATGAGARRTITLADGTHVVLAPQTTLTVSANFGRATREVSLQGQAHFDVTHTAGRPFVVRTGQVVTRVLGTAFDITHYADDRDVRVAVASGKVAVETPRHTVVTLASGMIGWMTDSTARVSEGEDVRGTSAWTQGMLEFHNTPVSDVLRTVGRWSGLQFELSDTALASHRVTTFLNYTNTTDLIVTLETVLNVTATSTTTSAGQIVTLHPKQHTTRPRPLRRDRLETLSTTTEVGR